ncbi:glycosyltransferase [Thalassoglobus polymorphus]|uniref:Alpha-D-kanosaminyltransferase n=1 Tax=Thalassoglobus polymorphus TaxID=2527994 RepID=A0A517QJU5_9PLAN|nr:glycosyltransferase [Thalassoglobus polymorphus]QDT31874.1 Alpha-D-kanosaminyltransferase [Thalassoglobus polymorphus]
MFKDELLEKDEFHPRETSPVRIAFCITELDPGGAEWALFHIVSRLDRTKWTPQVYCLSSGGGLVSRFEEQGVPVKCFGAKSRRDLKVFRWLEAELRKFSPEIVQGFLFHGNIVSRIAGSRAKVPIRLAGHRVAEREKRWHLWIDRLTKKLVQHHVCVSSGVAQFLLKKLRIEASQLTVIPNGIDPNIKLGDFGGLREELGLGSQTRMILAVGRLHRQKGFKTLLEAFRKNAQEWTDAHLVIVGEGAERGSIEAFVERYSLYDRVTLTGFRPDIPELMSEADLFVLSSLWEGMPNVVLQAMLMQLPVIATDVEGVADLITNGVSGCIVKPGSVKELRTAMQDFLADDTTAQEMAKKAKAVVVKEFTWDRVAREYDQLYQSLIEKV